MSVAANDARELDRAWFTAAELAELALPGLPADKRSINRRAQEERWTTRLGTDGALLVRTNRGRGGGVAFHVSLLPPAARLELARRGIASAPSPELAPDARSEDWRWFDALPAKAKAEAERRARIVSEIETLAASGTTRSAAVADAATTHRVGKSTLWNWLRAAEGAPSADRLPALAPRRKGGGKRAEIDPLLWSAFKSDYLRPSAPTLTSCYDRTAALATERGLACPHERTFARRLAEIDPAIVQLRREGEEAVRQSRPAQRRSVAHLHALEHVNIDGHRFDVFVKLDDGRVIRPTMVAIQDIYSRKLLSYRIGETESAVLTRLAFADLFRDHGIPKACTLDNGLAFASKWITGGAKTRFRFTIREEEPTGLLTGLGIAIHWATPYRGQSKPIERAFRDLCDSIAKHPAMEGAYTGNKPTAKPENYGSRAVPIAEFRARVAEGIAAHNSKTGRRTETARGRSFDATFAESYAAAPIGRATPEQMRMALLAAEQVRVNRRTGEVGLYGNRYWCEALGPHRGELVTARFDPDDLNADLHLYDREGRYIASAPVWEDTGFDDVAAAKARSKVEAEARRTLRAAADAEELLAAEELASLLPGGAAPEPVEPGALRLVTHRTTAKPKPKTNEEHEAREARLFGALGKLRAVE